MSILRELLSKGEFDSIEGVCVCVIFKLWLGASRVALSVGRSVFQTKFPNEISKRNIQTNIQTKFPNKISKLNFQAKFPNDISN